MPVDTAELRELLKKATPRPWKIASFEFPFNECDIGYWRNERWWAFIRNVPHADAHLIVTVINALPELVETYEERDTLRAEVERLREKCQKCPGAALMLTHGFSVKDEEAGHE